MTKNGIEFNLNKSNYKIKKGAITFYFSSKLYLEKFKNNVDEYIENESRKINAKYNVDISLYNYFMVAFYCKIEKRGFLIKYENMLIKNAKFYTDFSRLSNYKIIGD